MAATPTFASRGASRFWDRIAEKYARQPVGDEAAYQEKLRRTQAYLSPEAQVLEFGCGTGTTSLIHAPFAGHIQASDVSAGMIAIARRKAAEQGVSNVEFVQAGVDDLTVAPGSLDMVMAHSILHLLEAPEIAVAKAYEWLKPGGVLVSGTACIREAMPAFTLLAPILHAVRVIPYVKMLRQSDVERMMTDAGFAIEETWRPTRKKSLFLVARKPVVA